MLTTYSHLKAEDKYRRDVLTDQYETRSRGRVGKAVTALVVAGAVALAACGGPVESDNGGVNPDAINPAPMDNHEVEFAGMAAPDWLPDQKALEEIIRTSHTDAAENGDPIGQPADTLPYPGEQPASGPR